jgi:DNA polymerase-3 subunit gamma/tau
VEAVPASVAEPPPQAHVAPAARSAPAATSTSIDWTTLAAALPLGGLARQLALNCALLRHEGDSVELALDPGQRALHNKKWEEVLAKALSEHLGQPIRLTIQLGAGGGETPMAAQQRRGQERQADAQASIESDATVQSILDRFDGRIEPGSIQPVE